MKPVIFHLGTQAHFNRRLVRLLLGISVALGVGMTGCSLYQAHRLSGRIAAYEADVQRLDAERAEREKARRAEKMAVSREELEKTQTRAALVNRLIAQDLFPWCRLLDALEADLPPTLYLTEVRGEDGGRGLRLRGYAASLDQVSGYLQEKEDVALFQKIVLQNVEVDQEGGETEGPPPVRFEIDSAIQPRRVFPPDSYGPLWQTLRPDGDETTGETEATDAP